MDHKPLVKMMSKAADSGSPMQARHLSAISEFTSNVRHLEGKANMVADALSRVEIDSAMLSLGIDFGELAKAQRQDPDTRAARTAVSGLRLQDVDMGGAMLLCDMSQGRPRPWVPNPFRRTVFQAFHNLSHSGTRATGRLVAKRFIWHGLKMDTTKWAREYLACQRSKIHQHVRSALEKVPVPEAQFQSVNVDLVGPLPLSQGFAYLLTIVDRFSRWPEAIPILDMVSATVARAFLGQWMSQFSIPAEIISDRGVQFISQLC